MFKLKDFQCDSCNTVFEELVKDGEVVNCPNCNSTQVVVLLSAPNLNTMSCLSPQERQAKLKKRSRDHSIKEAMKNKDELGIRKLRDV